MRGSRNGLKREQTCGCVRQYSRKDWPRMNANKRKSFAAGCIRLLGDCSVRDPPVPIPNTEVKPLSPDGTARASVWESRTLPRLNQAPRKLGAFCFRSNQTTLRFTTTTATIPTNRPTARPEMANTECDLTGEPRCEGQLYVGRFTRDQFCSWRSEHDLADVLSVI